MSERQNIFRPIHKGIRSMIYMHASHLQSLDFRDRSVSDGAVSGLRKDLGDSLSNCVLCLLSIHSRHEEHDILSKLKRHDPGAVEMVMKEHAAIAGAIRDVAATCDEVLRAPDDKERVRLGDRLLLETDALFAQYMVHLNHEEDWVVPVMWQWFTDEQLNAMRGAFYNNLPGPLFDTWMSWTLPALNPHELAIFVRGLAGPSPNRLDDVLRVAKATISPERWLGLRAAIRVSGNP